MADVSDVYNCPMAMCNFSVPTKPLLLNHLRLVHSHDPRFSITCGIEGCSYTSKKFSTYYSHIYRKHPNSGYIFRRSQVRNGDCPESCTSQCDTFSSSNFGDSETHNDSEIQASVDELTGRDIERQRRSSALYILKLKEAKRVSQTVIDDIVLESTDLGHQCNQRLKASVLSCLANEGIDVDNLTSIHNVFDGVPQPFDGLETRFKQEKYFREHLALVEPIQIKIGDSYYIPKFSGSKRRLMETCDSFCYVPLLQSLNRLLQDPTVVAEINHCPQRMQSQNGTLEDFCDGQLYKSHPLFSKDSLALQIIAFYDELELCNPLGTHVKAHKLGIILFTLGNIRPQFRSSLRVINLAIAAAVPIIEKYGIDEVLKPFIADIKQLESSGLAISCGTTSKKYYGSLLVFLADNLASHYLGGFKESFSFAVRICRSCNATKETYRSFFNANDFTPRSQTQHEAQCQLLQGQLQSHYSKCYGINRRSSLMDLQYFSLVEGGLPHDAMHDLFEGVAAREILLLLKHCIIDQHFFTLEEYNQRLIRFDYGYTETDKPAPITRRSLTQDSSIHCTASQTILLIRILPLLVGNDVPEDDKWWKCFLILLDVVDIVLCPKVTNDICGYLKVLIEEHHTMFVSQYGSELLTPKFHYLLHYPIQIIQTGPLVRSWNMRNEAKLNFFKRASRIGNNFKNISFSVSSRHQRLLCYELSSGDLLQTTFECGSSSNPVLLSSEPINTIQAFFSLIPEISINICLSRPSWVKVGNLLIKTDNCYIITGSKDFCPTFGKVEEITVLKSSVVVLLLRLCTTKYYDRHLHSYKVEHTPDQKFVLLESLDCLYILHVHNIQQNMWIFLKWHFSI